MMGKGKYIWLVACMAIMLSACRTTKVLSPPPVILNNTDSLRVEYIERVRIDTVRVEIPMPKESDRQTVRDSTSHLETSLATSDAWINPDGSLGHLLYNKEGVFSADVLVPSTERQQTSASASVREVPVPYPEPVYIERDFTKWESFRLKAFWYLVVGLGISGFWIFRKLC